MFIVFFTGMLFRQVEWGLRLGALVRSHKNEISSLFSPPVLDDDSKEQVWWRAHSSIETLTMR